MSDYMSDYAAFEAKYLANGECPAGGGWLRLEQWDSFGPTMACGLCDCFGYDPADPRLKPINKGTT